MVREYYGLISNETLIRVIAASFSTDYEKQTNVIEFGSLAQYSHKSNPITHALLTLNFISKNVCTIEAEIYNPDLLDLMRQYRDEK
jgi:hypothetical protein